MRHYIEDQLLAMSTALAQTATMVDELEARAYTRSLVSSTSAPSRDNCLRSHERNI